MLRCLAGFLPVQWWSCGCCDYCCLNLLLLLLLSSSCLLAMYRARGLTIAAVLNPHQHRSALRRQKIRCNKSLCPSRAGLPSLRYQRAALHHNERVSPAPSPHTFTLTSATSTSWVIILKIRGLFIRHTGGAPSQEFSSFMSTYLSSLRHPTRPGFETEKNLIDSLGRAPNHPNDVVFGIGLGGVLFATVIIPFCYCRTARRRLSNVGSVGNVSSIDELSVQCFCKLERCINMYIFCSIMVSLPIEEIYVNVSQCIR